MVQQKQYTVKQIADLAGVSAGTVDRVLHNRGDVSAKSREKVQAVLDKIGYKPNLHVSSIGTKKKISIVAVLPSAASGYWEQVKAGIRKAAFEFSHINIKIKCLHYNQFDLFSCKEVYSKALELECDAMLIGPTFTDETLQLVYALETKNIPYVFVDEMVPNTSPLAFFGPDSLRMGYMQARLLLNEMQKGKDIVMLRAKRIGDEVSHNSMTRRNGFKSYIKEKNLTTKLIDCICDMSDPRDCKQSLDAALTGDNIGGIAIFNSRSYIVAEYLRDNGIKGIKTVGYGLIERNVSCLKEEWLTFLLSEHPDLQGYLGIKCILEFLMYGKQGKVLNYTPVDILISENVDYVQYELI